jgi:hypothetical protein
MGYFTHNAQGLTRSITATVLPSACRNVRSINITYKKSSEETSSDCLFAPYKQSARPGIIWWWHPVYLIWNTASLWRYVDTGMTDKRSHTCIAKHWQYPYRLFDRYLFKFWSGHWS